MTIRTTKTAPVEKRPETRPTTDPVDPDVQAGGGAGTPPGTRRRVWVALILAIAALAAVVTVATTAGQETAPSTTRAEAVSTPPAGPQEFLNSLANQGYIPQEAVDRERLLLERSVERGDVPAAALNDSGGATTLLYTPGEVRMIEAVGSGQVPREALGADLLERLAADGGPRGSPILRLPVHGDPSCSLSTQAASSSLGSGSRLSGPSPTVTWSVPSTRNRTTDPSREPRAPPYASARRL